MTSRRGPPLIVHATISRVLRQKLARLLSGEEMTAQKPFFCPSGGRLAVRSFISPSSLCGGPRVQERRGAHEVIGNDAEADPASSAIRAMVATAPQAVPSFDHTDAAFAASHRDSCCGTCANSPGHASSCLHARDQTVAVEPLTAATTIIQPDNTLGNCLCSHCNRRSSPRCR